MPARPTLSTIGFTKKSARRFFTLLQDAGVKRVLDVRLNNVSQLAGFAKKEDLEFFLHAVAGIEYRHVPEMAPTQQLIDMARQRKDFARFEGGYLRLIRSRAVEHGLTRAQLDRACLLCSEDQPEHCHRRILAEYLAGHFPGLQVQHLGVSAPAARAW